MKNPLKTTVKALMEAITGKTGTAMFPSRTSKDKIYPEPSFEKLSNIETGDPDVGAAIDFISDVVMALGFETSMNEKYTEKAEGKTAKEIVDDNNESFGTDQVIQEIVKDVVGYGNNVIWKNRTGGKKIEFLIRIMPASIKNFNFDETGLILKSVETNLKTFPADQLIWFNFNRKGKLPIGFGILQALGTALKYGGETREPFAQIKAKIQTYMTDQIENFSAPNQMWILPDCPDADLPKYHSQVQQLKKGQRITYNKAGATVVSAVPERMRGLDFYVETLWNSFYLGLQTPLPKLFTSPGFSQASATAAIQMGEWKVYVLRRYIKRIVEREIFAPWIEEVGLDPLQAKVRLNWGMIRRPDVNVILPLLLKTRENEDMTQEEWRNILRDLGMPLKPGVVAAQPTAGPKSKLPPATQPLEKEEHKFRGRREIRKDVGEEEEE